MKILNWNFSPEFDIPCAGFLPSNIISTVEIHATTNNVIMVDIIGIRTKLLVCISLEKLNAHLVESRQLCLTHRQGNLAKI